MKSAFRVITKILGRLLVFSLPSLLLTLLLLEVGLRLFVNVTDRPQVFYDAEFDLLKLEPDQKGTFTRGPWGEDLQARYHINGQGWNSAHEYVREKTPGTLRIAVIGDSFVEALQVDYDQNFTALLETTLNERAATQVEVYNFGISGAPLSHYMHVMRYVSMTYGPDIFIVNMVENDFDASFSHILYTPHLLQFRLDENGDVVEVPPTDPHLRMTARLARRSALVRFVYYNLQISSFDRLKSELGLRGNDAPSSDVTDAPIVVPDYGDEVRAAVEYTFAEFQRIAAADGSQFLLIVDAPRSAYYDGLTVEQIESDPAFRSNLIVREAAAAHDYPLLELVYHFKADFDANGEYLDFYPNDAHWNARAHALVAELTADELLSRDWME